jgi:hypothetical protein
LAVQEYRFLVSEAFISAPEHIILAQWNGLGADGSWINPFIPKTILGVDITLASLPHDFEWSLVGKSRRHFHISNLQLFYNICQILRKELRFLLSVGYSIAVFYYSAVETKIGYKNYLKGGIQ